MDHLTEALRLTVLIGSVFVLAGIGRAETPPSDEPPRDVRPGQVSGAATCDGPFAGHRRPTFAELDAILVDHSAWLQDGRPEGDPRRARLCEANLTAFESRIDRRVPAEIAADRILEQILGDAVGEPPEPHPQWTVAPDLRQADLRRANLADADFHSVPLAGAELAGADLKAARLDDADLSDADLRDADLSGAVLTRSRLQGTNLEGALLVGADFTEADLSGIDLRGFDLTDTRFFGANMTGSTLCGDQGQHSIEPRALLMADLTWVWLRDCDFSGFVLVGVTMVGTDLQDVNFSGADLSGVDFTESTWQNVNLAGADLREANFRNTLYHHKVGAMPNLDSMRYALNLHELLYNPAPGAGSPQTLRALRDAFFDAGMRTAERQVNHAVHRARRIWEYGPLESAFNFVLFEVTVGYGLRPERPLKVVAILIPVFALVYFFALRFPGADGIWQEWDRGRLRQDLGTDKRTKLKLSTGGAIRTAVYFSILSAFHIGWRDLNVGSWIQRVQPREYLLRASGWVRSVAGIQSLISVYLLALWLISYFGRPFVA